MEITMTEQETRVTEYLPPWVQGAMRHAGENLEEVRLSVGRPLSVYAGGERFLLDEAGRRSAKECRLVSEADVSDTLAKMSKGSLYAVQGQLAHGFLTLPGGHRAGVVGSAVMEDGKMVRIKHISAVHLRIAHAIEGCAKPFLFYIAPHQKVKNTLIISPPQCGKTTLLRDIARILGGEAYGLSVGIADERGEIAAMDGVRPGMDVGIYTVVMDNCPKARGMEMLIRSMSPEVVITDEIGNAEDAQSIVSLVNAGVKVICSAHGYSEADVMRRESLKHLIEQAVFECVIVLSRRRGPCTLESVR